MYKTKPSHDCKMPAPGMALRALVLNASAHMAKNLARNLVYYAQLLKAQPLVPKAEA